MYLEHIKQGNIYFFFSASGMGSAGGSSTMALLPSQLVLSHWFLARLYCPPPSCPLLLNLRSTHAFFAILLALCCFFQLCLLWCHWNALVLSVVLDFVLHLFFLSKETYLDALGLPCYFLLPLLLPCAGLLFCLCNFRCNFSIFASTFKQHNLLSSLLNESVLSKVFPFLLLVSLLYLKKLSFHLLLMNH